MPVRRWRAWRRILVFLFLGITYLTSHFDFVPEERRTKPSSQLGRTVLGENVLYYGYQAGTAIDPLPGRQ